MTVNSTGRHNRNGGRDFNENNISVGHFDGRNTINIAIPPEKMDSRPLVKAQRKELNTLVSAIAESGDDEAYIIWHKVHAEIGVTSIEDMTVNQYKAAISFLQAMLDRSKERDARKALVSLLLRNSEDNEVREKLIRYCHINFGTGRLNDLTRTQLQMALSWLDEKCQSINQADCVMQLEHFSYMKVIRTHPILIGCIFLIGFLIGVISF